MFSTWIGVVLLFCVLRADRVRGASGHRRAATTMKRNARKVARGKTEGRARGKRQGAHDLCLGRQEQRDGADPDRARQCNDRWPNWPQRNRPPADPIATRGQLRPPRRRRSARYLLRRAAASPAASASGTPKPTSRREARFRKAHNQPAAAIIRRPRRPEPSPVRLHARRVALRIRRQSRQCRLPHRLQPSAPGTPLPVRGKTP